jgi:glycosyltransferase involved in cell wall biosynthesis
MIIAHFSQDFRKGKPQLGGYSRILNQTLDGNEHIIFTIGLEYLEFEVFNERNQVVMVYQIGINNLNCYSIMHQFYQLPMISLKIFKLIKKLKVKPNILIGHAQLFNYYILYFVRFMLGGKQKILWEFNVVWGHDKHEAIKNRFRSYIQRKSQRIILQTTNGVIFQTNSSRDFIIEKYETPYLKNIVIKNAVTPILIGEKDTNKDASILIYGLFDKLNGIQFLIDALSNNPINNEITIHFLGDGPLLGKVLEFCKNSNNHKYLGNKNKSDTIEIIKGYKFGIIPRINTLGSNLYIPTKIVEMLNAGIVVLVSDVQGLTEVVDHDINGFVYKEGNMDDFIIKLRSLVNLHANDICRIQKFSEHKIMNEFNLNDQIEYQRVFLESL